MTLSSTGNSGPNALLIKLRRRIASEGPITLAQYMDACLCDPDHGYYTTRDPFGAGGDFTTAPEISQIFGELIGLWCVVVWRSMGKPEPLRLIELGPGRGTLMADALRAAKVAPEFLDAAHIYLVETSPVLREAQARNLEASGRKPHWHARAGDVPEGATILIANEFLDALPVRQFVRREGAWFERCVELCEERGLAFCTAPDALETPDLLPRGLRAGAVDGDICEIRPGADELVETLAARAQNHALAALFIDYGHARSAPGETLQAVRAHDFADPLALPGYADLTAHVDFGRLGEVAGKNALEVHGPVSQAEFLGALGLKERCERLMETAQDKDREQIASGALRVADPAQMGSLFKVMALTSGGLTPPAFAGFPRSGARI